MAQQKRSSDGKIHNDLINNRRSEHWVQTHWRSMMAWQYFVICLFDFMIAPIGRSMIAIYTHADYGTLAQWVPLTLQGGGLYHLAMGTIIGITSWQRSQEKINSASSVQSFQQPQMGGMMGGMGMMGNNMSTMMGSSNTTVTRDDVAPYTPPAREKKPQRIPMNANNKHATPEEDDPIL